MRTLAMFVIATFLFAFQSPVAMADHSAISDFGLSYVTYNVGSVSYGWTFALSQPISVSSLGVWDYNENGLEDEHGIGLWDVTGTPLAVATIPDGTAAQLIDGFRYQDLVSPLLLMPGQYTLGARYNGIDHFHAQYASSTPAFAQPITFITSRHYIHPDSGTPVAFPEVSDPNGLIIGANFRFLTVPEPATLWLCCVGMFGIFRRRRVWEQAN